MSRRWGTAVVVLAMTGLVAGCSHVDVSSTASLSSPASAGAVSPSSVAATSTPAPSSAPTGVLLAAVRPVAPPLTYTGSGDEVLAITKPAGATAVIASIVGNAAGKNFDIRAIDGAQDHLVTTTSPYRGSTLLDASGTTTRQLRVHAVGAWSITLTDVRSAPSFTIGYGGAGDAVLLYVGAGGSGLVQAEGSGSPFIVQSYQAGQAAELVAATTPWSGNVRLPPGEAIVTVRAMGAWSITVDQQ